MESSPLVVGNTRDIGNRLDWLDAAKGLAILAVIHYHFCGSITAPYAFMGQVGVDGFLIASGYGLTVSRATGGFRSFALKRLCRVIPAYWFSLAGIVLVNRYLFDVPFPWADIAVHLPCLHLAIGGAGAFSLNMSFWYMGLIVPMYVLFFPLRARLSGPRGVIWALCFCAAMALVGFLVLKFGDGWGRGPQIHSGGRFASFALGCLLGSISIAGPAAAAKQVTTPLGATSLAIWIFSGVNTGVLDVVVYPLGGLAIICAGVAIAPANRWGVSSFLGAIGSISYELYLVHQYLLLDIGHRVIYPWILALGILPAGGVTAQAGAGLAALAISCIIAWVLHAGLLGRNWRSALGRPLKGTIGVTGLLVVVAIAFLINDQIQARLQKANDAMSYIHVKRVESSAASYAEPVIYWGITGQADLIYLEHRGGGEVRLCIDHWGVANSTGRWVQASEIEGKTLEVRRGRRGMEVQVGDHSLVKSRTPPYELHDQGMIGINNIGFTLCGAVARSEFSVIPAPVAPAASQN